MSTQVSSHDGTKKNPVYITDHIDDPASDWVGVLSLFKYGQGVLWRLFLAIGFLLLGGMFLMLSAKSLGDLVVYGSQVESRQNYILIGVGFLAYEALALLMRYLGLSFISIVTTRVTLGIRKRLFFKMKHLPMTYFDHQPLGRIITRLTADVEGVEQFFNSILPKVFAATIQIVAVLIAMLVADPQFGLIAISVSLPALLLAFFFRKKTRALFRTIKRQMAGLNAKIAEYINGLNIIRAFGLQNWTLHEYSTGSQTLYEEHLRLMNLNSLVQPSIVMLCSLPLMLIIGIGGNYVITGILPISVFITYVRLSERLLNPIRTISQEIQVLQEALASSERVRQMLNESTENKILGKNGKIIIPIKGDIEFRQVTMRYGENKPALNNVSFVIKEGERVGLVGATGSGKTTTISLIPFLYPYQSGKIFIDGIDLAHFDRQELRRQIGFITQDVEIFRGTLRENLLIALEGTKNRRDGEVLAAAKETGLYSIFAYRRLGLDTYILDHGKNLSMGERQLIAITRIFLRNPRILILDEATASIDSKTEETVQNALEKSLKGRTCLIIAHRLNTITSCDKILVFKEGALFEEGNHAMLVNKDGYYASLHREQC